MLDALIGWSLRHRLFVVVAWLAIAVYGALAFARLPLDAFPDTTPVQVQVNATAPALAPEEIERQVTAPLEQVLSGMAGLEEVRSLSRFGLSQITLVFADGTDLYRARQLVAERIATADLPTGLEPPSLGPVATGLGEVFHYLVTGRDVNGQGRSLAELRTAQDWILAPQLRAVPGVAEVNSWGGDERQIEVLVDPAGLYRWGVSLDEVEHALRQDLGNVGGGTLDSAGESLLVQGLGRATRPDDVANVVVTSRGGVPIRISDLARVAEGREIRRGAVTADGKGEAVLGLGFMLMGENSRDVTERLAARLDEARASLPDGVTVEVVYSRTSLVDRVLDTVRTNLLEGALLVIAVLFAFLGNFRAGLVVAAVIPLSMLFAGDLMLQAGIAGSLMSLGAIDFGLLVDSAIIQVENAIRRVGDRPLEDRLAVIREAALEVRRPTIFGELIILVVYLPILALEGVEGKMFRPMALTVIFALAGSMLLSLTLTPVLTSFALRGKVSHGENALVRGLGRLYAPVLGFVLRHRAIVLGCAGLVLANGVFLATQLGSEFVPRLREGALVVNTVRLSGVSVDESVRYGTRIEQALLAAFPDEIARIWTRTGTAEVATDPMGVELSDVFVTLTDRAGWKRASTQDELAAAMQAELETLPGMRAGITQPIEMRVNEMVAGVRADVGVKIFGDDMDLLRRKAREVDAVLKRIPGGVDILTEPVTGAPVLEVRVDREAAGRLGIPAREILDVVEALGGTEVGEIQEGERRFPVTVRLSERYRTDPDALGRVLVTAPGAQPVPLSRVAAIEVVEAPAKIDREWGRRRVVVQANVRDRDVGSFVAEAKAAIAREVELPPGYYVRFGGQFEHLERARTRLTIVVPLALALIFGLLYLTYGRVLDALRVFSGVPFAAVGGVVALWLRDLPFSISAAVGFIALSGVAVLGDMVLVSTVRNALDRGMELRAAVEQAARERLRPVLMTALVASLGFVPMALNTGIGAEVQRPLATVVIGGVISSTALTLLVLPALYLVFGREGGGQDGGRRR
ncbi:MAG: CusA/CzcA family heavy metal efflux RND transporter [Pseudomonadota bacterium]|nr:CusA/CzcA family heavy metal efflux RND transporter [Pseudomonadota bacterium]